jgi:WD40 repeat protein
MLGRLVSIALKKSCRVVCCACSLPLPPPWSSCPLLLQMAQVWDISAPGAPLCLAALVGHGKEIADVAFSPCGRWLCSASYQERHPTAILWDLTCLPGPGAASEVPQGHGQPVRCLAWSPDGRTLVSGGDDGCVCSWDVSTGACVRRLHTHGGSILSLAWGGRKAVAGSDHVGYGSTSQNDTVISYNNEDRLWRWDAATGSKLSQKHLDSCRPEEVLFLSQGAAIAALEGPECKIRVSCAGLLRVADVGIRAHCIHHLC